MDSPVKSVFDHGMGILNGIIGDYLHHKGNPLATTMGFYHQGQALKLTRENLHNSLGKPGRTLCVLIHGLTNTESIWDFKHAPQENYGTQIKQDFNFTPMYVRYNSGLAVHMNGQLLTELLESLHQIYPEQLDEIILIGFSMGGLLIRSANHFATQNPDKYSWASKVKRCFYIGTPHQGAALEHLGYWTTRATRAVPKEYINAIGDLLAVRSKGIQDMRHGNIVAEGEEAMQFSPSQQHHFISGSLIGNDNTIMQRLLGDGLVNDHSATARHLLAEDIQYKSRHFEGLGHLALARSPEVYTQLKEWLV